jgi:hypothetical protein
VIEYWTLFTELTLSNTQTGLIGGNILHDLLKYRKEDFNISALNRHQDRVEILTAIGVKSISGDLESYEVIKNQVSSSNPLISILSLISTLLNRPPKATSSFILRALTIH